MKTVQQHFGFESAHVAAAAVDTMLYGALELVLGARDRHAGWRGAFCPSGRFGRGVPVDALLEK